MAIFDARTIQAWLNEQGFGQGLVVDGVIGPKTKDAIRRFQAAAGLATTGNWGQGEQDKVNTWGGGQRTDTQAAAAPTTDQRIEQILGEAMKSEFAVFLRPLLDAGDQELRGFVARAYQEKWGRERVEAELRTTAWFQRNSAVKLQWQGLSQAEKSARVADQAASVLQYMYSVYGRDAVIARGWDTVLGSKAQDVATAVVSGQMSWEQAQIELLQDALKDPKTEAFITERERSEERARKARRPDEIADELFVEARTKWWVPVTKEAARDWANRIINGQAAFGDFRQYLRDTASALYPVWATQLGSGVETRVMAAPYIQLASDELEIAPDAFMLDDRIFGSVINNATAKGQLPTLSEFRATLRQLPEFARTTKGKQLGSDWASKVTEVFGRVA